MLSVFKSVFGIDDINIFSDLLGTCRSLFGNNKGIAAILGTGSNSCLYDGEKIISNIPPLGYILGDEGSGAHLGKTLVSDLLKDQLPEELKKMFFEEFETSKDLILENVYRKPNANKYLASVSLILKNHIEETECYDIVFKCFSQFFERNILQYESSEIHTISFTGSVAENYNEVLFHVCEHHGMNNGKTENNPISGLIKFHLNQSL